MVEPIDNLVYAVNNTKVTADHGRLVLGSLETVPLWVSLSSVASVGDIDGVADSQPTEHTRGFVWTPELMEGAIPLGGQRALAPEHQTPVQRISGTSHASW